MIAKLRRVNGVLKVDIDGKIFESLSFKSFRPTPQNISDFKNSGVQLFSILSSGRDCAYGIPYSLYGESWLGTDDYNLDSIDKQIDMFIESAPDCYFALMIPLDVRKWYLDSHENFPDSYGHLTQMAYDAQWRKETAKYLKTVVSHVEEKYGDKIYAYFMLCGIGTEWLSEYDFQQSHPIKEKYYKDYTNNPDAVIPSREMLELSSDISFYSEEEIKIYNQAHAELVSDTILFFAEKLQEVIEHKKLVGLYFGYIFELQGPRLWNCGHLAYEKVFNSKDINIISSPASYAYRSPDSVSAFMVAYKTLDVNDKLYYFEFDQRTYKSQTFLEGKNIPPCGYTIKDDLEAVNLMRRDFMLCISNGASLWWFDMWNGWYSSPKMLDGIKGMVNVAKRISQNEQKSIAEVAVFVSGEALYKVNKNSGINTKLLFRQQEGLARMGAPYDVYSLGDIEKIDISQYKLFIFLTAFETKSNHDSVIEEIKKAGKAILWAYAPKYINGGLDAVIKTVGINLAISDEKLQYSGKEGEVLSSPYLYADDENAVTLVEYDDKKSAVVYKNCGSHTSFYTSIGNMNGELLRKIAKLCGVHIYCESAPVYINSLLIGVYSCEDVIINVRADGIYEDLFSGKKYESENGVIKIPKDKYTSKLLMKI